MLLYVYVYCMCTPDGPTYHLKQSQHLMCDPSTSLHSGQVFEENIHHNHNIKNDIIILTKQPSTVLLDRWLEYKKPANHGVYYRSPKQTTLPLHPPITLVFDILGILFWHSVVAFIIIVTYSVQKYMI